MKKYFPYNPNSTTRIQETAQIKNGKVVLRHIPQEGSVLIEGFTECDARIPMLNQFSCEYAADSLYRDANRVLHFNAGNNGETITINYVTVGTVVTADDMNEIKAHLDAAVNDSIDAWEYKGTFPNGSYPSDEDEGDLKISGKIMEYTFNPPSSLKAFNYFAVENNSPYEDMQFRTGDALVRLPTGADSSDFFYIEKAMNRARKDKPVILMNRPSRTKNKVDGNIWVDDSGDTPKLKLYWHGEEYTFSSGELPIASSSLLGGIKVGYGLAIAPDGTLSVTLQGGGSSSSVQMRTLTYTAVDDLDVYNAVPWKFYAHYEDTPNGERYYSDQYGYIRLPLEFLESVGKVQK